MSRSLTRSNLHHRKALQKLPLGVSSNFRYWGPDKTIYARRGHGCRMWYIDDNEDRLPGPLWNGLRASADANSTEQCMYYAAPYLKIPPLSNETAVVSLTVCPRYLRFYSPRGWQGNHH